MSSRGRPSSPAAYFTPKAFCAAASPRLAAAMMSLSEPNVAAGPGGGLAGMERPPERAAPAPKVSVTPLRRACSPATRPARPALPARPWQSSRASASMTERTSRRSRRGRPTARRPLLRRRPARRARVVQNRQYGRRQGHDPLPKRRLNRRDFNRKCRRFKQPRIVVQDFRRIHPQRRRAKRVAEGAGRRKSLPRLLGQCFQQRGLDPRLEPGTRGIKRSGRWLICACIKSYSLVAENGGVPDSIS